MIRAAKVINLVQGEYAASADPKVVMSTVLGSCVSACIFDLEAGVGGMNHFLRAEGGQPQLTDPKYGKDAMDLLIKRVMHLGGKRGSLQAKLFGGARMTEQAQAIGDINATFAIEYLQNAGIPCVSQSLGGTEALRIQFTPNTGSARLLRIADHARAKRLSP